jgi:hypothetical protein
MFKDPIVEEVRRYREQNAAKFGFDVRKIAEDALRRQATSGHRVVDLSRKPSIKRKAVTGRKRRGSAAEG